KIIILNFIYPTHAGTVIFNHFPSFHIFISSVGRVCINTFQCCMAKELKESIGSHTFDIHITRLEVFENVILIVSIQIEKLFIMFLLTDFLHTMDAIQKHLSAIQFGLWAMCIRFLWLIWAFHIIFMVLSTDSSPTINYIHNHPCSIQFGLWPKSTPFLWLIWSFHIFFMDVSPKSRQLFVDKVRNPKRNST